MCIICNPALSGALKSLSFKSRRQVLRGAAGGLAGVFVAEAIGPAAADGSLGPTLGKGITPTAVTIYVAKSIITMERGNPRATAVAVAGAKILAVGSLQQVEAALAGKPHRIDRTFADKILVPGLIDQHLHPVLGALSLSVEVIATEDWRAARPHRQGGQLARRIHRAPAGGRGGAEGPQRVALHLGLPRALARRSSTAPTSTPSARRARSSSGTARATSSTSTRRPSRRSASRRRPSRGRASGASRSTGREGPLLGRRPQPDHGPAAQGAGDARAAHLRPQADGRLPARQRRHRLQRARCALHARTSGGSTRRSSARPTRRCPATFIVDGRGIPDRVGLDEALAATEEQIAVAPAARAKLLFFPRPDQALRRRRHHLAAHADEGRLPDGHQGEWIMTPDELRGARQALLERRLPAPHPRQRRPRARRGARHPRALHAREPARRPPHRHRPLRQLDRGAGRPHRPARRHRQRQPVLPGRLRRQVRRGRAWARARADAMVRAASVLKRRHPALLPLRPADGPGRTRSILAWCAVNRITPSGRVAGPEQRIGVDAGAARRHHRGGLFVAEGERDRQHRPGQARQLHRARGRSLRRRSGELKDVPIWGTVFEGTSYPVVKG